MAPPGPAAAVPPDTATIENYGLSREMVPTEWLHSRGVWEALLEPGTRGMPQVGLLAPMAEAVQTVVTPLTDPFEIRRDRLHPPKILVAIMTYRQSHEVHGKLT